MSHSSVHEWRAYKCTPCNRHFMVELAVEKRSVSCPHCMTPSEGGRIIETGGASW